MKFLTTSSLAVSYAVYIKNSVYHKPFGSILVTTVSSTDYPML